MTDKAMKTHNVLIYHCLHCGVIAHREPEQEQPTCCGRKMVKAATETIFGDDRDENDEWRTGGAGETPRAEDNCPPKPR
jgi:hypothetical protein